MRKRRPHSATLFAAAIVLTVALTPSGCGYPYAIIRGEPTEQVKLIVDSPEVRRLIAEEFAREERIRLSALQDKTREHIAQRLKDEAEHPERYTTGRKDFLASMESQPAVVVHGQAYSNRIEWSLARCTMHPYRTTYL